MRDPDPDRQVGVEVEFHGLDTLAAGRVLADALGGDVEVESNYRCVVKGSVIGDVEVELDTRYAHPQGEQAGVVDRAIERLNARDGAVGLLSSVTPVELITEPLTPDKFGKLEDAIRALREAGAEGTEAAALFAFGVHLNITLTHGGSERAIRIAAAYAFAERWLRDRFPVDPSRRVVPFIDPYPKGFRTELAEAMEGGTPDIEAFIRLYNAYNPSRNHGLDLWPLLGHLAPETAARIHDGPIKNARPAFHYRWPDSRVGNPDWSVWHDLDHWILIERAADDPARLERIRNASHEVETGKLARSKYMEVLDEVMA